MSNTSREQQVNLYCVFDDFVFYLTSWMNKLYNSLLCVQWQFVILLQIISLVHDGTSFSLLVSSLVFCYNSYLLHIEILSLDSLIVSFCGDSVYWLLCYFIISNLLMEFSESCLLFRNHLFLSSYFLVPCILWISFSTIQHN